MTNGLAIALALLIGALLAADALWLGWNLPVLAGRKLADLIEYLAFWR